MIPVGPELLIVVLVIVLLFGASKIPKLAHALGQSKGELHKGFKHSKEKDSEE